MMLCEGLPQLLKHRVVIETFDGAHLGAVACHGISDAGARDLAVDLHRAGTADAMLAADVRPGEQQGLAQEVGEVGARSDIGADGLAVDGQSDGGHAVDIAVSARCRTTARNRVS